MVIIHFFGKMLLTIFLSFCLAWISFSEGAFSCGQRPLAARIIGGTTATPHSWPWQLSLRKNGGHICGATLIKSNWAVTAAHCVKHKRASLYSVMVGGHHRRNMDGKGKIIPVSRVISHPGYANNRLPDLAILQLREHVRFSSTITPACLPKQGQVVTQRGNCYISGWGMDNGGSASTYLKQSKVPVYTHQECRRKHWVSEKDNICLGGRGSSACNGDSGGPLVCQESGSWVLRGASSYVTGKNCPVDKYSVYARVSSYIDWISGYTGGSSGGGGGGGGGGGASCQDNNKDCRFWKYLCGTNDYVKQNCKATCEKC